MKQLCLAMHKIDTYEQYYQTKTNVITGLLSHPVSLCWADYHPPVQAGLVSASHRNRLILDDLTFSDSHFFSLSFIFVHISIFAPGFWIC